MNLGDLKTETTRPKMSRDQLADIIRANVTAFKDEENFNDYLTDLVIYLMEYEYDWPDADTRNDMLQAQSRRQQFIQQIAPSRKHGLTLEARLCRMCGADLQGKEVCPCCLARNRV